MQGPPSKEPLSRPTRGHETLLVSFFGAYKEFVF